MESEIKQSPLKLVELRMVTTYRTITLIAGTRVDSAKSPPRAK